MRTDVKYQVLLDQVQVQVLVDLNNQVSSTFKYSKMCTWQVQVQVLEYLNPTLVNNMKLQIFFVICNIPQISQIRGGTLTKTKIAQIRGQIPINKAHRTV